MSSSIRRARVAGWTVAAAMVVAFTTLTAVGASGVATRGHRGITWHDRRGRRGVAVLTTGH